MPNTALPGAAPLWMINDASTVAEKLDFVRRCHAGGIPALTFHSRAGNLLPYASREWYETVRAVVVEAARLGMQIWLYDEDPFPSGAAGGMVMAERPELFARAMARRAKPAELQAGQLWFISEDPVLWAGLVPLTGDRPAQDLTRDVGSVRADWFMGEWDSRYYYQGAPWFPCPRGGTLRQHYVIRVPEIPAGYELVALVKVVPGEDTSWNGYPDLLNPESFASFRRLSLDVYREVVGEYYGTTIPGIFTDEPKYYGSTPVTPDLFSTFQAQYGYELLPRCYQLFGEPQSETWVKTRLDYRRWCGERFLSAFLRPYRRYCEEQGLLLIGHVSPEDDPIAEAICLTSHMPILKELGCPGTDIIVPYTGTRTAPGLNLGSLRASSVRAQFGAPYAISETLALTEWDVTSRLSRQLLAWQKVLGIDRFCFHGFFQSNEGVTLYEAPPDYGPNTPLFRGIGQVNAWLQRVETTMDGSEDVAEVAVLNALTSYYPCTEWKASPRLGACRDSLWFTLTNLLRSHVGQHLVDEPDLAAADAADASFQVGRRRYRYLLIPDCEILPLDVLAAIGRVVAAGVPVYWFGQGPRLGVDAQYQLVPLGPLPGARVADLYPAEAWCQAHLPQVAQLTGDEAGDVYLRRYTATDGVTWLLGANLTERQLALRLAAEPGHAWQPVEVDGDTAGAVVSLAPYGTGRWRLATTAATEAAVQQRVRVTGAQRTFQRLGPNVIRLQACTVVRPGQPDLALPYPKVYSFISHDYRAQREMECFLGPVPVVSVVPQPECTYRFAFAVQAAVPATTLVLDPRCARGRCTVWLDGAALGGELRFPLETTQPARLAVPPLAAGDHQVELRFHLANAMEGVFTHLYLEGDFLAEVGETAPAIRPDAPTDARTGWPDAGLPFYGGDGVYRWNESFTAAEAKAAWTIAFDDIVDAAELLVNGQSVGSRAWAPFRWALAHLRAGENQFELRVSSTAGNRFKLIYPRQPQGWLGQAHLLR